MSEAEFAPTRHQLLALYNQGAYVEALNLLEREAARFPQQGLMYHWMMCLAARADEPDKALLAFREALDKGYWYPAASCATTKICNRCKGGRRLRRWSQSVSSARPRPSPAAHRSYWSYLPKPMP